jgi:hypothetical protein
MGEKSLLSTVAALLAGALNAQGRDDEAEGLTTVSERTAGPDDLLSQVLWRGARARARAAAGRLADAEALARAAVELAERTDYLDLRGDAATTLADVLFAAEATGEGGASARAALELYERKGNVVSAELVGARLLGRGA